MHPIFASLESASPSTIGAFLHQVYTEVKKLLQQGIDTAEERTAVIHAVMAYYDKYINELVPGAMQTSIREGIVKGLTAALETAATI